MKKVYLFSALILCIILIAVVVKKAYALLETRSTLVAEEDVGAWVIKINNDLITDENLTFTINNFEWSTDSNVKNGKLAPGLTGSFKLLIDPTGTDVSVRYDINFDLEELENLDIVVTSVSETNGHNLILTDDKVYTGVIPLSEINNGVTHEININVSWLGDNDESDTAIGMADSPDLALPIEITLTQYLGDTIDAYVPENSI